MHKINGITSQQIAGSGIGKAASAVKTNTEAGNFGNIISDFIQNVEKAQKIADIEAVRLAEGAGNLHQTAIALEQAEVTMRLMVGVRNKVVDTYKEIMSMPV